MNDLAIVGPIFTGLCLVVGMVSIIYQRKKKIIIETQIEKNLDNYSYRDLFHFFINPEFHFDKFNLAKGFYLKLN